MAAAKKEEKKPVMSCASSGHITKLKQSIFGLSISMVRIYRSKMVNRLNCNWLTMLQNFAKEKRLSLLFQKV
jgi:hypothetical protein